MGNDEGRTSVRVFNLLLELVTPGAIRAVAPKGHACVRHDFDLECSGRRC